jgi:diguanylate cyclase (GGDEF)-like protein/PAS domain S-box-containing protein
VRTALLQSRDRTFEVERLTTCAAGVTYLQTHSSGCAGAPGCLAAVLVDLRLPDAAGMEILDRLQEAAAHIPIVVLSSSGDEVQATLAIQRGAQDFLLKDRLDEYLLPKTLIAVIERAAIAEALFDEKERAQVTLNSIGDAVISTNFAGRVTYLNIAAERLTGWSRHEAIGLPLDEVFRLVNSQSRATVPNPMKIATTRDEIVDLPSNCILVRRDGSEAAIEDSSAPIHDRHGRVTGAVMTFRDVTAARALTLRLAYLAQHDSLTGLPNRILLNDRLAQSIAAADRHQSALAVLYLDIDRFKHINDSLGHPVGDRLLQAVAARLCESIRATDTVSRLGGDEFVILLSEVAHPRDAALCADKLLDAVRAPYVLDESILHVSASIGVALFPGDGGGGESLLQNADSAMYEAKANGRNNYQFYRSELNSSAGERHMLETELRNALERNELELHYQPVVELTGGSVAGVEALLRWCHPTLGIIAPSQFVPIAEETGMIVPLGRWALRAACRQAAAWADEGLPGFRIAVNVSPVELQSQEFLAGVQGILSEEAFDPRRLELEITETFLMQDAQSTLHVLKALKNKGIRLALDDFGTGYSSLSYMRRFPIDAIKVDRSFVRNLTTDEDDASVVSAIINMGRSLHLRVVAEGVETEEQLSFLRRQQCSEVQGYFYSPPLRAADLSTFVRAAAASGRPSAAPVDILAI